MSIKKLFFLAILSLITVSGAEATTITRLHLGGVSNPNVFYFGPNFHTSTDADAATPGDQNTDAVFEGYLSSVADILSGASFTLENVQATLDPIVVGSIITQNTINGNFSLYGNDPGHTLLLAGSIGNGVLVGSDNGSTGTYFNSVAGNLTSGSLLGLLPNTQVFLSFTLSNVLTNGVSGLDVIAADLQDFTANAQVVIDVNDATTPAPEPMTLSLLGLGLLGGACLKKKKVA